MNRETSNLWTDRTTEYQMTGTWRSAVPEYATVASPCHTACPLGGEIAEWIHHITLGDTRKAWLTLLENNPFPAIIGRVCHHPCQSACNRVALDETVGICALERFVGDMALAEGWRIPAPTVLRPERVAVIGGGPAGLSAAYQLLRAGVSVAVFEGQSELGGLLRHAIPSYRLDKRVLDGELARLSDLGLEVHTDTEIPDAAALGGLMDEFDAVYMATGASRPKHLPVLDYTRPYVVDSADFLRATGRGEPCVTGARVLVIGGGSAAMDVARSARRLGREVCVMSLEPAGHLPAQAAEISEALEEGITFETGAMLTALDAGDSGLDLRCTKVDFSPGDARGTFSVTPIPGSEFTLVADTIIPAIGQDADVARWAGVLEGKNALVKTGDNWRIGETMLFAGGDLASMDRFVSAAIGMGKEAANAIIRALDHSSIPDMAPDTPPDASVPFRAINTAYQIRAKRNHQTSAPANTRLSNFVEVQQPLDLDKALAEATRCFSCGTCIFCDNCYFYCPDMAISKLDGGYQVKSDYCKGCGLCVAECPTGAVHMKSEGAQ